MSKPPSSCNRSLKLGAKTAVAGIILAAVGGGALVIQFWNNARAGSALPAATAAPATIPAAAEAPGPGVTGMVSGTVRTPEGRPLANAQAFLSTAGDKVPVYSEPAGQVISTVTSGDGRFSFPADSANRAVIVIHEAGYGQAPIAELAAQLEMALQPWARIEGTLREGTVPQANQTVHLSRTRFGSKQQEQVNGRPGPMGRGAHPTASTAGCSSHHRRAL